MSRRNTVVRRRVYSKPTAYPKGRTITHDHFVDTVFGTAGIVSPDNNTPDDDQMLAFWKEDDADHTNAYWYLRFWLANESQTTIAGNDGLTVQVTRTKYDPAYNKPVRIAAVVSGSERIKKNKKNKKKPLKKKNQSAILMIQFLMKNHRTRTTVMRAQLNELRISVVEGKEVLLQRSLPGWMRMGSDMGARARSECSAGATTTQTDAAAAPTSRATASPRGSVPVVVVAEQDRTAG